MLSSFPGLPTKSFLKSILHSNENERHKVSVSIRFERQVISGVRPTDQRRSAGTTFSGSDDWFLQLTRSYSATCTRSSQLQRWHAAKRRFSFRFQKALPVYSKTRWLERPAQRSLRESQNGVRFPWKLRRVPIAWPRAIGMSKNIDIDGGTKTCERFELSKC